MAAIANDMIRPGALAALLIAVIGAATILGAYYFQYGLNIAPCPLCLMQRRVWYVAIPLALVVALAAMRGALRALVMAGLAALALAMLIGAGIGAYHAGIEWKWWPGPQECSGPISAFGNASDLLRQMQATSIVRCDEVQWRFLGLSLAGYNALISGLLAMVAVCAAARMHRPPARSDKA